MKNINEEWKDLEDPTFKENALLLRRNSVQALFNGYYYDYQLAALQNSGGLINTAELGLVAKVSKTSAPTPKGETPSSQVASHRKKEIAKQLYPMSRRTTAARS